MYLDQLLEVIRPEEIRGERRRMIQGLQYDSRKVEPGDLFLCIKGYVYDGHDFIGEAARRGAVACLVERPLEPPAGMTLVRVRDSRMAAGPLADLFFGRPSRKLRLVGVTGTNGKTTTSMLCRQILKQAGQVGLIGSVENIIGEHTLPVERTTPEAIDLQEFLQDMVSAGSSHAVMEVSSHSLVLHRVDGCRFAVGVFTNLTRDHLDFHGDLDHYLQAKARLFREFLAHEPGDPAERAAVVNADDPHWREMIVDCPVPVWTYGVENPGARVRASDVRAELDGTKFTITCDQGAFPLRMKLMGKFNVSNALAAFTVGLVEKVPVEKIIMGLEQALPVKGRFERIPYQGEFSVIVDYAHTPDGLENILKTAREVSRGRVILVFGCGGDRDRGKRPLMGKLAGKWADHVLMTSDNPRTESPQAILDDIEQGILSVRDASYERIEDRSEAIHRAVDMAKTGDIVIIAGKGHETYQIFSDRTIHFDDGEVVAEALRRRRL